MKNIILLILLLLSLNSNGQTYKVNIGTSGYVTVNDQNYSRRRSSTQYSFNGVDSVLWVILNGSQVPTNGVPYRNYLNGDAGNAPFASMPQLRAWMNAHFEPTSDTVVAGGGGADSAVFATTYNVDTFRKRVYPLIQSKGTLTSVSGGAGMTGTVTTTGTIGIDSTKIDFCVYNSGRLASQTGSMTLTYTPSVALGNYRIEFFLVARNNGVTAATYSYTNGAGTAVTVQTLPRARNATSPFTLSIASGEGATYPIVMSATNATPISFSISASAADYDFQVWIYKKPN